MPLFSALHEGVDRIQSLPGIRHLRAAAYARRFRDARAAHLFRGLYASHDEAARAAPRTAPLGYDHAASTDLYIGQERPTAHDYPAFFWLMQSITSGAGTVVDLGGNVGVKFAALRSITSLPAGLRWLVVDVPAVVRRGRELHHRTPSPDGRLRFSDEPGDVGEADVLYASGTLQYLPDTLGQRIVSGGRRPRRIVVNTTPIHANRSFFTLNNIGSAFCVYRVTARADFVGELEALGYKLRDEWSNVGKAMRIPFESGFDVEAYSGLCFDLRDG